MNKVLLQFWEESERGWGVRPDGCSLHMTIYDLDKYLKRVYTNRDITNVPDEYERTYGDPVEVYVNTLLFDKIKNNSIRLSEYEFNNLKKSEDIIFEEDYMTYLMQNN